MPILNRSPDVILVLVVLRGGGLSDIGRASRAGRAAHFTRSSGWQSTPRNGCTWAIIGTSLGQKAIRRQVKPSMAIQADAQEADVLIAIDGDMELLG